MSRGLNKLVLLLILSASLTMTALAVAAQSSNHVRQLDAQELKAQQSTLSRFASQGLPIYCGGGRQRLVALTFDDGPSPYTRQLVGYLASAGVPATFFSIGANVHQDPSAVTLEATVGYVGDHTWSHPHLTKLSSAAVSIQLRDTRLLLDKALPEPTQLFRPPYGDHDARVDALARGQGLVTIGWSLDSNDWRVHSGSAVYANVNVAALRPGAIVLLHEIHPQDLAALPRIVALLRRLRLTPVTVPEMLSLDPPTTAELSRDHVAQSCSHLSGRPWPSTPQPVPKPTGPDLGSASPAQLFTPLPAPAPVAAKALR